MSKSVKTSSTEKHMPFVEIKAEDIATAAAAIPQNTPVYMVNLLRYRERAEYADGSEFQPCSGREAYTQRYVPAFRALAAPGGVKVFWLGAVLAGGGVACGGQAARIGSLAQPAFAGIQNLFGRPDYPAGARTHRKAALAERRLVPNPQT